MYVTLYFRQNIIMEFYLTSLIDVRDSTEVFPGHVRRLRREVPQVRILDAVPHVLGLTYPFWLNRIRDIFYMRCIMTQLEVPRHI